MPDPNTKRYDSVEAGRGNTYEFRVPNIRGTPHSDTCHCVHGRAISQSPVLEP